MHENHTERVRLEVKTQRAVQMQWHTVTRLIIARAKCSCAGPNKPFVELQKGPLQRQGKQLRETMQGPH